MTMQTAIDNAQAIVDDMRARLGNASFLYSENQFLIGTSEALGNLGHYLGQIASADQRTADQCIYLFSDGSRCQNDVATESHHCAECQDHLSAYSPEMVRAHNLDGRGSRKQHLSPGEIYHGRRPGIDREYDCGVSTGDLARDNKDPHDITS